MPIKVSIFIFWSVLNKTVGQKAVMSEVLKAAMILIGRLGSQWLSASVDRHQPVIRRGIWDLSCPYTPCGTCTYTFLQRTDKQTWEIYSWIVRPCQKMVSKTVSKAYFHYIPPGSKIFSWVKDELMQLAEQKNIRRKKLDQANQIQTYAI